MNDMFSKLGNSLTTVPLYGVFRKLKKLEAEGKEVISLAVGEPHYETPREILDAMAGRLENGKLGYAPSLGSMSLRQEIGEKFGASPTEVAVGAGAKPILAAVFSILLDENSVLLLPKPYYPPFEQVAKALSSRIEFVETGEYGFQLTLSAVEAAYRKAGSGIVVLVVNSPNNPTGQVYDKDELKRIIDFASANGITVVSDECYRAFSPYRNFSLRDIDPNVIVIDSFSKSHTMMGARIGYAIAPAKVIEKIGQYADNFLGCPSVVSEVGALTALKIPALPDYSVQRIIIYEWLDKQLIPCHGSGGGIYAFADFSEIISRLGIGNAEDLAYLFLEQAGVATIPGISFGSEYGNYLRLSYAQDQDLLSRALFKLEKVIAKNH